MGDDSGRLLVSGTHSYLGYRSDIYIPPISPAPLARGVLSPVLWVSVCWRRGELGAFPLWEAVFWLLLI